MAKQFHILLTGPPGVGKTTLVKKLHKKLLTPVSGFYTEEIRSSSGLRLGFDIVSLEDETKRAPLARESSSVLGPKVGKYTVNLSQFESIAIPCLQKMISEGHKTIIIDEIGTVENIYGL